MKKSNHNSLLTAILAAALFAILSIPTAQKLLAQPTNYCRAFCQAGMRSCWCYDSYAYFTDIMLRKESTGEIVMERHSPNRSDGNCYRYRTDIDEFKLQPGERYCFYIRRYSYYHTNYTMIYIDWNIDGDFYDRNLFSSPTVNEKLGQWRMYEGNGSYKYYVNNYNICFTVPEDITDSPGFAAENGHSRMRLITNYAYDYGPCCVGRCSYQTNWGYGEGEDFRIHFEGGIKNLYPGNDDVLYAGEMYDNTWRDKDGDGVDEFFKKPTIIFSSNQKAGTKCELYIWGPLPSEDIIYRGLDRNSDDIEINVGDTGDEYTMEHSEGLCSYPKAPYEGDGSFKSSRGGTYKIYAVQVGKPIYKINVFTVSWDDDLAALKIISPRTNVEPQFFKYLRGQTIRVTGVFQNVGLNDVSEFYGIARIWDPDGDLVYRDSMYYEAPPRDVLSRTETAECDFRTARFNRTGIYTLQICSNLMSAADDDDYNDCLAREDANAYTFAIAYEIQLQAHEIIIPSQDTVLLANRPVVPIAVFKNVGIGDASDVPAKMIVKKLPDGDVVYECNLEVTDVPSGKYNTKRVSFDPMAIEEAGEYEVCIIISSEEDPVPEDDTLCATFIVDEGMRGIYTVGKLYEGRERNFPTIDSVMNDLYLRGITGSCIFELTDAEYTLEGKGFQPAWDFSSMILGLGYDSENEVTNSVTWRPARNRSYSRGGVTINLESNGGYGLMFGQSAFPSNPYAIMTSFPTVEYANSPGYITFDGGRQKSLRFALRSGSNVFGAALYLNRGSEHITIRNCLIENETPAIECRTWIPLVTYDPSMGYMFESDITGSGATEDGYSAGIVNRSTLLRFEETEGMRLDTITNSYNVFDNNEISGFGYGIMSLGLGSLYLPNENRYQRYYNAQNVYKDNIIYDVCRVGILVGNEENSEISGNRIYDIGGVVDDAYGIMAGGNSRVKADGYNNVQLEINGNEISNVSADELVMGINVEQVRITYQDPSGGVIYFPDEEENMTITNNVVWGLNANDAEACIAGITVSTRRDISSGDVWEIIRTPFENDYFTNNDNIVNNTVIISDDGGNANVGPVCGIGILQSANPYICNNAILFEDESFDPDSPVAAAIFYEGTMAGLNAERNAFWLGNADATIYRFIETDDESNVLEAGARNEFATLEQWQIWTGQDQNSVVGDFFGDLAFKGNEPYELRIDDVPDLPQGSVLNNRGERVSFVTSDIDGNPRGSAGQRYDIGAFEFNGRMYISDIEMLSIPNPGAYRSGSNAFNDAEYIMTESPVNVIATLRNNGSLQQSDIDVHIKIYREDPYESGKYLTGEPVVEETVKASVASTESITVNFNLADGLGTQFEPQTYSELIEDGELYDVPYLFSTMTPNVTPKYKVEVSVEADQHNENNVIEKEVRFYLKHSGLHLLLSSENSMRNILRSTTVMPDAPTADEIAGRLNIDSLMGGLHGLGWFTDVELGRYDLDLFDRKGWEPRSVNYRIYRSMFWSDGDDVAADNPKGLTRYERIDIERFLTEGDEAEKKNLIIGSQELVRELCEPGEINSYDPEFVAEILRAESISPYNPLGPNGDNDGNQVFGVAVGTRLVENINSTLYTDYEYIDSDGTPHIMTDQPPYCGLMGLVPEGVGLARVAYTYVNIDPNLEPDNNIMGIATTTLKRNVVMFGVDWRHWGDMERVLRSVLDFIEKNGGTIVPVELANFDAVAVGKRVDISWATASELNSDRFEIERADLSRSGRSEFAKIDEMKAAGKSAGMKEYGPVVDYDVEYGNSYVYRLKIIDLDGNFKYSEEKVVTIGDSEGGIRLSKAVPNPSAAEAKFDLELGNTRAVSIVVYDVNGKIVQNVFDGSQGSGSHVIKVDLEGLSNGSYTLVLRSGEVYMTRNIHVVK